MQIGRVWNLGKLLTDYCQSPTIEGDAIDEAQLTAVRSTIDNHDGSSALTENVGGGSQAFADDAT